MVNDIGEHTALLGIAICAASLGAIGLLSGHDGVFAGGTVAVIASIAGYTVGRGKDGAIYSSNSNS